MVTLLPTTRVGEPGAWESQAVAEQVWIAVKVPARKGDIASIPTRIPGGKYRRGD